MNYSKKRFALLMGALIIGQAITMQNVQSMEYSDYQEDRFANPSDYELYYPTTENKTPDEEESWSNSLSYLYNQIINMYKTVSDKPIQKATKATIELASWSKPVTKPIILSYAAYSYLPVVLSYPLLTWKWAQHIQSIVQSPQEQEESTGPTKPSMASQIFAQITDGAQDAGITAETIQNGLTTVKNVLNPGETIKAGYTETKNAIGTVKNDVLNSIKHEIRENIDSVKNEIEHNYRAVLNIPDNQKVNIDTVTDKVTNKLKDEIREAKVAIEGEMEHKFRAALNIPDDQALNIKTATQKLVEEPVRAIFNIDKDTAVTADAVMYNVAKNTVYRFGIPTAALIAATPIAITAGYFGCKYAYYRLTTEPEPPIFIESSETSRWQNLKNFVLRYTTEIPDLAYSEDLERTFDLITRSTINSFNEIQDGKKNIFYEPVLMYGPPGTGKTAKAKQMIKQIYQATDGKMQWRITNGSMLLNAGQKGINQMFDWLNRQSAACLFIDEADTLFPDRDEMEKYPERLEIVNHLLSLIGERSNKFMIIMTTNRLGAFDEAMARRIDNLIHIPLPNEQGRDKVLKLYRDNMLLNKKSDRMMELAEKYCPSLFTQTNNKKVN